MPPATEKPLKICIRGLPTDTDHRKLQKDLRELGFDAFFIRHVPARDKGPGIFCVQLQINPQNSTVCDVKKLLGVPVRVEEWRGRKGPPQCQRCQGFQHSAAECLREYRCVHCARPHPSKNCNRPYDIPTCANCGGPHAANDLSCPAIRREEIAKAGKVLRANGYTLATSNPVVETNALSSLMAVANTSWQSSLRKRRRKNARENRLLVSHERPQSQSEKPIAETVVDPVVAKPKVTQGTQNVSELNKPQPLSKIVQEALSKSISSKESQPVLQESRQQPADNIVNNNSQIPVQALQQVIDPIKKKSQATGQQNQKPSVKTTSMEQLQPTESPTGPVQNKESQSTVPRSQQASTKPSSMEQRKPTSSLTYPDPVRTKAVTECVLVLQSVLSAIKMEHDPVPIILEGIAELCRGA